MKKIINEIEIKIACHEISAAQVFTQMRELIDSSCDLHYRNGYYAGWNAGHDGDERKLAAVEHRNKF